MSYEDQMSHLNKFVKQVETREGKGVATALRYRTACKIYNLPMPNDADADMSGAKKIERGATMKALLKKEQSVNTKNKVGNNFIAMLAYGGAASSTKSLVCPPSLSTKKWDTIDCHLQ